MPIPAGSLVVQWLRLCVSTAEGECLIPGQRTKVLYASGCGQKKKKNEMQIPDRVCTLSEEVLEL